MSRLPPEERLRHILAEARFLIQYISAFDRTQFLSDRVAQHVVERGLEIIGEATKKY